MKSPYYLSAIIAFLIWGMFSLVLKPLSAYPSIDILLYRVAFAACAIGVISIFVRGKISLTNVNIFREMSTRRKCSIGANLIFSAITLALNWFLFIYVMNNVSVNATALAYLICPILTTVMASIFLKERLNIGQWVAVGLSILSCLILSYGHFIDMLYSFVIALTYAGYLVLQKKTQTFDKFFALTIHIFLCCLMLLPLVSLIPEGVDLKFDFYFYVAIIAVLFTIIPLFLNAYALKGLDSSVVGVLLYLNPLLSFLIAVFYFEEQINTVQVFAYGLIFTAVVLFNLSYMRSLKKLSSDKVIELSSDQVI